MAKKIQYQIDVDTRQASQAVGSLDNQFDDLQEKSSIDIVIENANAVKSIGDLRKSYKELLNIQTQYGEGTEEFKKAAIAAGGLKDKLDAVKESVKSFSASPIENVANSFTDLKSKVLALDIDGIKQSFSNLSTNVIALGKSMLGIGTSASAASIGVKLLSVALAATGITLVVGAIALLVTQFDDLSSAGGLVGKVFTKVGEAVKFLKDYVLELADSWGLIDKNATTAAKAQQKAVEETAAKVKKAAEDAAAAQLEAEKKAAAEREALRKKQLEEDAAAAKERKKLFDDITNEAIDSEEEYENAVASRIDYTESIENAAHEAQLKRIQDASDAFYAAQEAEIAAQLETDRQLAEQAEIKKQQNIANAYETASLISNIYSAEGPMGQAVGNFSSLIANSTASLYEMITTGSATALEYVGASLQIANDLVGSIGGILSAQSEERIAQIGTEEETKIAALQRQKDAGIITEDQLARGVEAIQKRARAAELKEKKKAFEQNKAIQIVQAVIGTAQGIVAGSQNAFPLNIIMMALAAAVGAAQIGIISSQSFPSGGGGGGAVAPSAPPIPPLPGTGAATGPNINFAAAGSGANLNTVGGGASSQPIIIENNVSISETQVTNAQTTVAGYQAGSELGGG